MRIILSQVTIYEISSLRNLWRLNQFLGIEAKVSGAASLPKLVNTDLSGASPVRRETIPPFIPNYSHDNNERYRDDYREASRCGT